MATGGDINEVRYNHPTLGTGVFYPKAGESNTFDLGGVRTGDDAAMIDGAGQPIYQMNRVRGFAEIVVANNTDGLNSDLQTVKNLSQDPVAAEWTVSLLNGNIYGITGKPVGDLQLDSNAATFTLKISGGEMKRIL